MVEELSALKPIAVHLFETAVPKSTSHMILMVSSKTYQNALKSASENWYPNVSLTSPLLGVVATAAAVVAKGVVVAGKVTGVLAVHKSKVFVMTVPGA